MSGAHPDSASWQEHLERMRRTRRIVVSDHAADDPGRKEWTATPPGRLGRRLLADVEPYLAFFAIARAD